MSPYRDGLGMLERQIEALARECAQLEERLAPREVLERYLGASRLL